MLLDIFMFAAHRHLKNCLLSISDWGCGMTSLIPLYTNFTGVYTHSALEQILQLYGGIKTFEIPDPSNLPGNVLFIEYLVSA